MGPEILYRGAASNVSVVNEQWDVVSDRHGSGRHQEHVLRFDIDRDQDIRMGCVRDKNCIMLW